MKAFPLLLSLSLATAWVSPAWPEPARTDINIVTAIDISDSVSAEEMHLQIAGLAAALRSPQVLRAFRSGPEGRVGFTVFAWHDHSFPRVAQWTVIASEADAEAVAREIEQRHDVDVETEARQDGARLYSQYQPRQGGLYGATTFYYGRLTNLSGAIDHGVELLDSAPFAATRTIINIIGEGTDNVGEGAPPARNRAMRKGVIVNGLVSSGVPASLAYYRSDVVGGTGSFVIPVASRDSFAEAMVRKFIGDVIAANIDHEPRAGAFPTIR